MNKLGKMLLVVGLTSTILMGNGNSHNNKEERKTKNIENLKNMIIKNIDSRISLMNKSRSCILSANSKKDIKSCKINMKSEHQRLKNNNKRERNEYRMNRQEEKQNRKRIQKENKRTKQENKRDNKSNKRNY